ncbi:MAG: RDD family protein [Terriglobia bacterium]
MKFDFDAAGSGEFRPASPAAPKTGSILDQAFEAGSSPHRRFELESIPLEGRSGRKWATVPSVASNHGSENPAQTPQRSRQLDQVELIDATFVSSPDEADFSEPTVAPLRKRFLAGLADAGILLIAGCLFAGLYTLARGKLGHTPLDLAVAGLIAAFWIFVYFGSFTAVTLRTPGQAAFGLSVSNLDGERPTREEAFLRAFGYLVSLAALMLGFLWAAMDSDGMSWHDHISGTILVETI